MRAASKKPRAFAGAASLARRRPAVTVPRSLAIGVVPLRWQGPVMGSGFASGAAPATPELCPLEWWILGLSLGVLVAGCELGCGDGIALGVEQAHGVF